MTAERKKDTAMMQIRYKAGAASVAAAVVLTLAACGAPPGVVSNGGASAAAGVYESFDSMPAGDRMKALIEAAEEEGSITAYLRSDDVFADIETEFEAEYDIDLTIVNPGRVELVQQQLFEQKRAGRVEADVVEVFTNELNLQYADEDVIAEMPSFLGEAVSDPTRVTAHAIESIIYPYLPVWNTNAVSAADAPTSIKDFADSTWVNKMVLTTGNQSWYMTIFEHFVSQGMTVAEFEELFRSIAANSSTTDSNNTASSGLASGEYIAGPGVAMVTAQRLGEGAPIDFEPVVEPVGVAAGVGLLKDAQHPAAAMLFAHWYLTKGLDIVATEQFVPWSEEETDLSGVELLRADPSGLTTERLSEWRTAYNNLLSGSGPILPEYVRGD